MTKQPLKVALLKGGWNSEREISLQSAAGILPALLSRGFEVVEIDVTRDIQCLTARLKAFMPDVVFLNALHGQYVEDGQLQGLMEMLGYPYTGSNAAASAVAFDKGKSRDIFKAHDVRIPEGKIFEAATFFAKSTPDFPYPFVAKPLDEGSSVGVFVIHNEGDFQGASNAWIFGDQVLVERYIPGRELSIAFLDHKPLGVLELRPKDGFYDYKAKYTDGLTDHIMPTDLPTEEYDQVMVLATRAVQALGVRGVSRADIRFDDDAQYGARAFVLEVNTLPGMTPLSIVPEIAAHGGYDYETLCEWMVKNPICA